MKTIRMIAQLHLSYKELQTVSAFLKIGELVAIPTETVYGLAADLFQPIAVQKIFHIKGRPPDNPLIAHISSRRQLERLVQNPSQLLLRLAERFWPGPLTLVFERRDEVPGIVSAHLPTIAVRMPSHPCARQIIEDLGSPLAAPSANLSGCPSPTSIQDVLDDLDGRIAAAVDGGPCAIGIESTVVGLIHGRPVLLRPGAISRQAIEEELKQSLLDPPKQGPILSPGMKYRHYAPKAKVHLLDNPDDMKGKFPNSSTYMPEGLNAQNLYSHLRKADRLGYSEIVIVLNSQIRLDEALMNRLSRACSR
jgi:L-threonylcarbamoyladenylate synthase